MCWLTRDHCNLEFEEDEKMDEEEEEDHKMHEDIEDMQLDYKTGDEGKEVDASDKEEHKQDVLMQDSEELNKGFLSMFLDEHKRTHEIFKKSEARLKIPKIILDKFQALIKRLKKTLKDRKYKTEE